jgi:hypothetical protein
VTDNVIDPNFVLSCFDVAVIVAVPAVDGVKRPLLLIMPALEGLTDQRTVPL